MPVGRRAGSRVQVGRGGCKYPGAVSGTPPHKAQGSDSHHRRQGWVHSKLKKTD